MASQVIDFEGETNLFHFQLLRSVGKGAFGKVRLRFRPCRQVVSPFCLHRRAHVSVCLGLGSPTLAPCPDASRRCTLWRLPRMLLLGLATMLDRCQGPIEMTRKEWGRVGKGSKRPALSSPSLCLSQFCCTVSFFLRLRSPAYLLVAFCSLAGECAMHSHIIARCHGILLPTPGRDETMPVVLSPNSRFQTILVPVSSLR